ncbi:MAG: cadmium-translocating P-type ATPase [Desulfuromonadales bacterium]|nr:MAG: cadmium-translocating P-type ATPase [Desulfuromonadales bacterium]
MTAIVGTCYHCGAVIPHAAEVLNDKDGERYLFCCRGCHGAWLLITGAGLDDFYRRRDTAAVTMTAPFRSDYGDAALATHVYGIDGVSAIDILIEGVRCAACVWLNERMIARLPGVSDVRVNYATGRARVIFDAGEITPAGIFDRIAELGYVPRPFTRSAVEDAAERERKDLLVRFGTAVFLSMQLMGFSIALYAGFFQGIAPRMKDHLQQISLLVAAPVVFYAGWPFLAGAWRGIRSRAPGMDLLIAVGALSSFIFSAWAAFTGGEVYAETAAMIVTLILAGRLLEHGARRRAASGVERLMTLMPAEARRLGIDGVETVPAFNLSIGNLILVAAGDRFPVDGTITAGTTEVDESPASGEPLPVAKTPGSRVIAGSVNLSGQLEVRVERPARESFIARVARLVDQAQSRRAPIQQMADRVASRFVPLVLFLAATTFVALAVTGTMPGTALMAALSVTLIACPCAMGLATPTAVLAGSGAAASVGAVFRGGDILERLSRITVAAFDKTGTLTEGRPSVVHMSPAAGWCEETLLRLAASVEAGSRHPVGEGIAACARSRGIAFSPCTGSRTVPGAGVLGMVDGRRVLVGNDCFLADEGVLPALAAEEGGEEGILAHVAVDGAYAGTILLADHVRQEAKALAHYLAVRGVRCIVLSGDRQKNAERMAARAGIGEVYGGLSPADKACRVEELRRAGEVVLMVGDGINDAPALAAADVGCAFVGGTDIAVETSDLVLARPDMKLLGTAHALAVRTLGVIRQNLAWAFVYNLVGIPLAMTGRLTPVYAAAAMAVSSLCVIVNSVRLTKVRHG